MHLLSGRPRQVVRAKDRSIFRADSGDLHDDPSRRFQEGRPIGFVGIGAEGQQVCLSGLRIWTRFDRGLVREGHEVFRRVCKREGNGDVAPKKAYPDTNLVQILVHRLDNPREPLKWARANDNLRVRS
jgi:hypothetical protein